MDSVTQSAIGSVTDQSFDERINTIYRCEPRNATPSEARRVICMTFKTKPDGTIQYGAAIFKREFPNERLSKKALRKTAIDRLAIRPITFLAKIPDGYSIDMKKECDQQLAAASIRKMMFKKGTGGDRIDRPKTAVTTN
jgi:hypothetical protein